MKRLFSFLVVFLILSFSVFGCYKRPEPIPYGDVNCYQCGSLIVNKKFGAEMLIRNDKKLFFDSFECLVRLRNSNNIDISEIVSNWVINYSDPGELIYVPSAYFLKANKVKSPSGLNILAFKSKADREAIIRKAGGEMMTLNQVIEYVKFMDSMVLLY